MQILSGSMDTSAKYLRARRGDAKVILGYPEQPSLFPGDTLKLHVSTAQPYFRVEFYRQGKTLERYEHPESNVWKPGQYAAPKRSDEDWNWPAYDYKIPDDWPTGAYIAMFFEADENKNQVSAPDVTIADGREAKTLFVVKNPMRSGNMLYKLALFTYQCYNAEGDPRGSIYQTMLYKKVSLHRPGGATGGTPSDVEYADVYDMTTPRQVFAHWDVPFIQWVESQNYSVDYCTDLDVHYNDDNFIESYPLLLSVGHDEYWSEAMRQHVEAAIAKGVNVAFFSANVSYWRVTFESEFIFGHRIQYAQVKHPQTGRPWAENNMTGVSYRNGGGKWTGKRDPMGYTVQYADHWVYENTGRRNGDVFGKEHTLIGYECDGVKIAKRDGIVIATGTDQSPPSFTILGISRFTGVPFINNYIVSEAYGDRTATMGIYTNTGCVFTAATVDWPRVLAAGEPTVVQITRNVIDRLQARGVRLYIEGVEPGLHTSTIEGQPVTFRADTASLSVQQGLHYQWTLSTGNVTTADQPGFQTTMPSRPVTVTVTVMANGERVGFGTLTVIPQSASPLKRQMFKVHRLIYTALSHIRSLWTF